jgi:diadenosine tetraphosphate (Ap4A) HIT family hydrolase
MSTAKNFTCDGGTLLIPHLVLCDRADGGHLVVNPPRDVWERSELTAHELARWSFLVAATGEAMLAVLPQLEGGCVNYWEAGNWALNDLAEPVGAKPVKQLRRVHLHIFGRSRDAKHYDWRWGESPKFPDFVESRKWASQFNPLRDDEFENVKARVAELMQGKYAL